MMGEDQAGLCFPLAQFGKLLPQCSQSGGQDVRLDQAEVFFHLDAVCSDIFFPIDCYGFQ